jgi:hypothetical protein
LTARRYEQLKQIIGTKGQANDAVYQFAVPRRDPITENGIQITPAGPMGVATAIDFQPTGGDKATITANLGAATESRSAPRNAAA